MLLLLLRKATINCCDTLQQLWSVSHWISASSPANWWTSSRVIKRICPQISTFVRVVTEALRRLVVHGKPKDKEYGPDIFVMHSAHTGWRAERTIINPVRVLLKELIYTVRGKIRMTSCEGPLQLVWWCNDDMSTILIHYDIVNN